MKHKILSLYVFAAGMLLGGCAIESPEAPRGNKVTVTASMRNDDTKVALYQDDTSLSLFAAWEYEDDYVVPILNNGMYKKAQRTKVYNISDDRMTASFNYELEDDYFIPDAGYQFLCFTENCNAMIIDDEVYYNASLEREILSRYRAPMFAERNNVKSKSNIGVNFGHYLTYEILHLKNTSSEQITFSLNGFNSPDGIWYKTQGAICHRTGKFLTESEAAKAPITKSPTYYFPAGYDDAFISAYIPIQGMKISNATLVAEINGETVTSSNTKSSNVELKTGHAYHMYVEWDGKELKFVDGFNDTLPDPDAEYVDLGLPSGTLWATCNLGATKPEEYGLYYQWGDTQGYGSDTNDGKYFDWSTYKWCDGSRYTLTKYNTDKSYGIVDNMVTLMSDDDAARAALGSKWRMPSNVEWEELLNNCTLTWTTVNGVNGYKLQSKVPGYADSWIFLPAAGARSQDNLVYVGDNGYYYSSSIALYLPYGMSFLFFSSSSLGANMAVRSNGMSIRPVYAETEPSTVSVTTTDIDFGDVKVGTSVSKTFKITNTGSKATNVTISESYGIATSDFSGVATLAEGESKTITLTCSPNEIGSFNGGIDIIAGNWCQITYKGNAVESTGGYSYEYVDLGLSVKWATCNLGATKPEEYGLYYQWGDTQGYGSDPSDGKDFGWSTYKWCNGSYNSLTKYNTNSTYGTVDNKTVLEMEDDAARAALGGNWRMPTDAEWTELRENCTWTWTINYNGTGVAGRIVTSNKTGYTNKSIFLPAAGYRSLYGLSRARSYGYYWSSSIDTDCPVYAWDVLFYLENVGRVYDNRCSGQSVRPVYTETEATPSISVTPTDLDFGTVKVGSSATASFTVTNTGSAVANVSISAPSAPVTSDISGNITLNAGASKTVTLTYSPKEKGSVGGSISVVSGGNTTNVRYSGNAEESTGGYSYEYVDLGLSVKWATCNLGATTPEEYGLYYHWGDTQGYGSDTSDGKYFDWRDDAGNVTYKWCNGSYDSLTKYNTNSSYGTVDNKMVLDMEDDAARAALGGNWRMPTDAEWTELRENCTWTWTINYNGTGVAGRIVTSNKTGYTDKSIFLPAAGFRHYDNLYYAGSYGAYWSSSLYTGGPYSAWDVFFYSDEVYGDLADRPHGPSVRPVLE
ncbi:MAG: choice-of-anchor D domain-containing protein [Bacteroidales bacterium]|nr:choice-of-anchor D domain-containing protein [Bacteroidales bacterium]